MSANTLDANGPQGTQQLLSGDGATEAAGAKSDQRRRVTRAAAKALDGDPAREKGKGQHRKEQFEPFPGAENCLEDSAESPSKPGANEVGNHSGEGHSPWRRGCGADGTGRAASGASRGRLNLADEDRDQFCQDDAPSAGADGGGKGEIGASAVGRSARHN